VSRTSLTRWPPPSILADLHLDADTIIAAILHDVIEDTPTPKDQLAARFGADVAELVDGVTKLDQIKFKSREEAQAESFRKMLLAMVRDLRVILVKLADRTHNMRTIEAMAPLRTPCDCARDSSRFTRRSPSAWASTT
jgi:guanosine-3',5'-bis(diphosphate) 3'-pyrophosphohydrolase